MLLKICYLAAVPLAFLDFNARRGLFSFPCVPVSMSVSKCQLRNYISNIQCSSSGNLSRRKLTFMLKILMIY